MAGVVGGFEEVHRSWRGSFNLIEYLDVPDDFDAICPLLTACADHYSLPLNMDILPRDLTCYWFDENSTFDVTTSCRSDEIQYLHESLRENITDLVIECEEPSVDLRAFPKVKVLTVRAQQPFAIIQCTPIVPLDKLTLKTADSIPPLQPVHAKSVKLSFSSLESNQLDCSAFRDTETLSIYSSAGFGIDLDQLPSLRQLIVRSNGCVSVHSTQPRHLHSLEIKCQDLQHSPHITTQYLICHRVSQIQSLVSPRLRIVDVSHDFPQDEVMQLSTLPLFINIRISHRLAESIKDYAIIEMLFAQSRFQRDLDGSRHDLLQLLQRVSARIAPNVQQSMDRCNTR